MGKEGVEQVHEGKKQVMKKMRGTDRLVQTNPPELGKVSVRKTSAEGFGGVKERIR